MTKSSEMSPKKYLSTSLDKNKNYLLKSEKTWIFKSFSGKLFFYVLIKSLYPDYFPRYEWHWVTRK